MHGCDGPRNPLLPGLAAKTGGSGRSWLTPRPTRADLLVLSVSPVRNLEELRVMYAIIVDGGKQYKVKEGQELAIDYRDGAAGDKLTFDRVLAVGEGASLK